MNLRHRDRPTTVMLVAIAMSITVGLAACGSSDATSAPTSPVTVAAPTTVAAQPLETVPDITSPEATSPAAPDAAASTSVATPTTDSVATISEAEVTDIEKQLDEIDQLLAGVDSDLSRD